MSETMSAEIWIGGKILARTIPRLCKTIADQGVTTDWGDGRFRPQSAEDLLAACKENHAGVCLLWLCDDQARWGQFELLESFLQKNGIGFTRSSEGRWEYEPERVEYRPPGKPLVFATNHGGEIVVPVSRLTRLTQAISRIRQQHVPATPTQFRRAIALLCRELKQALSPCVPPLKPFEIVGTVSRSTPRGE